MKQPGRGRVSILAKATIVSALLLSLLLLSGLLKAQRLAIDDLDAGIRSDTTPSVVSLTLSQSGGPERMAAADPQL